MPNFFISSKQLIDNTLKQLKETDKTYMTSPRLWVDSVPSIPPRKTNIEPFKGLACFCTIATKEVKNEFAVAIYSLRQQHDQPIYVLGDRVIQDVVNHLNLKNITVVPYINEEFLNEVYKMPSYYVRKTTSIFFPENPKIFYLMYQKAHIMEYCLRYHPNVTYFDSDLIFLNPLKITGNKPLACTPHYQSPAIMDCDLFVKQWGYYNCGLIYCSSPSFLDEWSHACLYNSNFVDQDAFYQVAKKEDVEELGLENNIGDWRVDWNKYRFSEPSYIQKLAGLEIKDNIYINEKIVSSFHTHLYKDNLYFKNFRTMLVDVLAASPVKKHKELLEFIAKVPKLEWYKNERFYIQLPKKMAVISVLFRPMESQAIIDNMVRFQEYMAGYNVEFHIVEGILPHQESILSGNNIHRVKYNTPFFQKEALMNIALTKLSDKVDKVAWLDADIELRDEHWIKNTSKLLQKFHVIQMYENGYLLDVKGKPIAQRPSIVSRIKENGFSFPNECNSGYAWAARRSLLDKYGFFDRAVGVAGDFFMYYAFLNAVHLSPHIAASKSKQKQMVHQWSQEVGAEVNGNISFLPTDLVHFYHGKLEKRIYGKCVALLENIDFNTEMVKINGCWEYIGEDKTLISRFLELLKQRDDDEDYDPNNKIGHVDWAVIDNFNNSKA